MFPCTLFQPILFSLSCSGFQADDSSSYLLQKISHCSDAIKKIGTGVVVPGECTEKLIAGIQSHLAMKLQQLAGEFRQSQQQYMESKFTLSFLVLIRS